MKVRFGSFGSRKAPFSSACRYRTSAVFSQARLFTPALRLRSKVPLMSSSLDDKNSRRVLLHAPFGRDAALISSVLRQAGIEAEVCLTVDQICTRIVEGAGALLVA